MKLFYGKKDLGERHFLFKPEILLDHPSTKFVSHTPQNFLQHLRADSQTTNAVYVNIIPRTLCHRLACTLELSHFSVPLCKNSHVKKLMLDELFFFLLCFLYARIAVRRVNSALFISNCREEKKKRVLYASRAHLPLFRRKNRDN